MRHQWLAYSIVAVLSIGAGIAVAGLPNTGSADPTIVVPASTDPAPTELVETTRPPVATDPPPETTTTTEPPVTSTPDSTPDSTTSSTTTTTTEPAPVLADRATLDIVVANGANIGGIASATARELEDLGYVDVRPTDGTEIVFFTIVYYEEGFIGSAERLATDLELAETSVAPMGEAPDIIGDLSGESLLVYLGSDQADRG